MLFCMLCALTVFSTSLYVYFAFMCICMFACAWGGQKLTLSVFSASLHFMF